MKKQFPVFDCDAHVNDPVEIWTDYVEPRYRDHVRQTYWSDGRHAVLNGGTPILGGNTEEFTRYNVVTISGPGMNKKLRRRLQYMALTREQLDYLDHKGAYEPQARLRDLDLMGIDQVMIIPTTMVGNYPFARNAEGAYALARAYNNWAHDFCGAAPERLYAAGWLPLQDSHATVEELRRLAKRGVRMSLVRPIDAQGNYPSQINAVSGRRDWDRVFRTFEETGMVLGMHTFPSSLSPGELLVTMLLSIVKSDADPLSSSADQGEGAAPSPDPLEGRAERMFSPGQLVDRAAGFKGFAQGYNAQTLSFIYEAATWLAQVLLTGFLDRYPGLRMAILESNATWLPGILESLDRYFVLYGGQRRVSARRLPSEAFYDQCFISFEGDETPVFRQWDRFQDVGVWASDTCHHDGADAWSAMRAMEGAGVPEHVQAQLMGGNALRMYGIQPRIFVEREAPPIPRPAWFPTREEAEAFAREQQAASASPRD